MMTADDVLIKYSGAGVIQCVYKPTPAEPLRIGVIAGVQTGHFKPDFSFVHEDGGRVWVLWRSFRASDSDSIKSFPWDAIESSVAPYSFVAPPSPARRPVPVAKPAPVVVPSFLKPVPTAAPVAKLDPTRVSRCLVEMQAELSRCREAGKMDAVLNVLEYTISSLKSIG